MADAGRVQIAVDARCVQITIRGWDALWALCRRVEIPIASVKGVAVAPSRAVPRKGLRLPGTAVPGVIRAGSYGTGPAREFWLVRKAAEVLVIELEAGAPFRRIVLEVPDPRGQAQRLRPALGSYTGSFR